MRTTTKTLYFLFFIIALLSINTSLWAQGIITATYSAEIPTSYDAYDASCTGPSAAFSFTLPAGDNYTVTGIDISYSMTALGNGSMNEQRSQVHCQNTNMTEGVVSGVGASTGTYSYARSAVSIANGSFPGGTKLIFEMRAWRTFEGTPGCHPLINKVDPFSWTMTVHYDAEEVNPKVGIETASPEATLDIDGEIKLGSSTNAPQAGMVRWNTNTMDFEGYNGTEWMSFTQKGGDQWGRDLIPRESFGRTASDGGTFSKFGSSVSISGDYAVVGALRHDVGSNQGQGQAYIFHEGLEADVLTASDGAAEDEFGTSVSISGDWAIIGAPRHKIGNNQLQGQAYIFEDDTYTDWTERVLLTASDGVPSGKFGTSVSISGDYAIVGAPEHPVGGNAYQGQAYIFKRSGNTWVEQTILTASDGANDDYFGASVSISGDYAIVGIQQDVPPFNSLKGKAYVFKRSGTTWTEQSILVASDGINGDGFGFSVSISGDYAIVSALEEEQAYIFKRNGIIWAEQTILIPSSFGASNFGSSVSISGDYAVVGVEEGQPMGGEVYDGYAYIFKRIGTIWIEETIIAASDGEPGSYFGSSVSISNGTVIIGALSHNVGANQIQGKVYFFNK